MSARLAGLEGWAVDFCASAIYAVLTGSDCGALHHPVTPRIKSMLSLKGLMVLCRDVFSSPDSSIAANDLVSTPAHEVDALNSIQQ